MNTIANETIDNTNNTSLLSMFKNSRFLQICTALLVVQLGLAAVLGLTQKKAEFNSGQPLFALTEEQINSLGISNQDETIELTKQNENWVLAGTDSLPVDSARLNTLLESLLDLKVGLPVASSVNAREQLEVADDNYQRRLVINNDSANTYLLGTSPGLRKAHLRREGSDEIFSAALPVSSVPSSADNWLDKSLLALKDISRLSTDSIKFESTGAGEDKSWQLLDNTDESKSLNTAKLTGVLGALESLTVSGLSDTSKVSTGDGNDAGDPNPDSDATNEDAQVNEAVELSVTSEGKDLTLSMVKQENTVLLTRSDMDQTFSAPISVFDHIAKPLLEGDWLVEKNIQKHEEDKSKE